MFSVHQDYQPLIRQIALDAQSVFTDPRIKVWRSLPDRQNCTLDQKLPDGRKIRFHIKRYPTPDAAKAEVTGHELLITEKIPTAPLVAHGQLSDGRSFVIFDDLTGYSPADKLIEQGTPFEPVLIPTANLAAHLHAAGLHHRDLYLCHFLARPGSSNIDIKLIDTARVARLTNPLTKKRWIVKDLAQFWYSTTKLPITDDQRTRWLAHYTQQRNISSQSLQDAILSKSRAIARHDKKLTQKQPGRHISIPGSSF